MRGLQRPTGPAADALRDHDPSSSSPGKQAFARSRLGVSVPGNVAQPVSIKTLLRLNVDASWTRAVFSTRAGSAAAMLRQTGTMAVVIASPAMSFAIYCALPPVLQPPKLKPRIDVAIAPPRAL